MNRSQDSQSLISYEKCYSGEQVLEKVRKILRQVKDIDKIFMNYDT